MADPGQSRFAANTARACLQDGPHQLLQGAHEVFLAPRDRAVTGVDNVGREVTGVSHTVLATARAETLLLAGRIEFFDLRQPDDADATFIRALRRLAGPRRRTARHRGHADPG
jgi:hypothetical protein